MPAPYFQHSPADVVRHLLVNLGVGVLPSLTGDWPIYEGSEPEQPDNAITLYDQKGLTYGRVQLTGTVVDKPGVLFRVRSWNALDGFNKASEIARIIDETVTFDTLTIPVGYIPTGAIATYLVESITRIGTVHDIGKNAPATPGSTSVSSKRNIFTLNAVVSLRQIS